LLVGVLMTGLPVAGNVAAADGEAASAGFAVVNDAWAEGDHPRVRALLAELLENRELAPHVRSYAHLRLAQSYRVTGDTAGSRREYKAIAGRDEYPWIHRYEAGEWLREFDRLDQGLPARDPTAPRTPIALIDNRHGISGGWNPGNSHWTETREGRKAGAFLTDLYHERYPEMARMFDDQGVNHAWRNLFYRCGQIVRRPQHMELLENAVFGDDQDPGLADVDNQDFRLRTDAPVFGQIPFRPIPVEEIGLYEHPLRASWPVETASGF
jgi:hypothetical protein